MDTLIIVALITSGCGSVGAILLAVWALLTAYTTRKQVLKAEIEVKHEEELRTNQKDALSTLLKYLVDYKGNIELAHVLFSVVKDYKNEVFSNQLGQAGISLSKLSKYALENGEYLPGEVISGIQAWKETPLGYKTDINNDSIKRFLSYRSKDIENFYYHILDIFNEKFGPPKKTSAAKPLILL